LSLAAAETDHDFATLAAKVNAGNHGWTAVVPDRFKSHDDVKDTLGAFLPGDAEYEEPDVMQVEFSGQLPDSFDSAAQWPSCSVISNVRDQSACGTCWAFGSVESFESRACITTGNDIKYSPEDTGFCSNAGNGCNGGNSAWNWFRSSGVVTGGDYPDAGSGETCYPYSLAPCAHHVPATAKYPACPGEGGSPRCARACSDSGYGKSYSSDKVRAASAYSVRGEEQIMQELVNNGPMYVAFTVYSDFPTYKSGVYKHTTSSYLGGHAVLLVGYGTENGQKYWKIKNSWNEEWGDNGHFKIVRGTNECGIESSVSAGTVSASMTSPVQDGACSASDQAALSDPDDFGAKASDCGHAAFSLVGGFDHDKFNSCFTASAGVSSSCSECYAQSGEYAVKNCKLACISKWCSSGCLSCTDGAKPDLNTCTGFTAGSAQPCDGDVTV